MKKKKIAFLLPNIGRHELQFNEAEPGTIKFFFTQRNKEEIFQELRKFKRLEPLDFVCLKEFPFVGYSRGFCLGLIPRLLFGKYDIVISRCPDSFATHISFLIAKLKGIRFILTSETWLWPNTFANKLAKPYMKYIMKNSDSVVVSSKVHKEFLLEHGVPESRIEILERWYETDKLPKDKLLKPRDKQKTFNILYIGRIIPYKGLKELIKIYSQFLQECPNSFLTIVGKGTSWQYDGKNPNYEQECIDLANEILLSDKYKFYGWQDSVGNFYTEADVVVMPNVLLKDDRVPAEAFGRVLVESLKNRTPVIATKWIAAAYDFIKDGYNGYIVEDVFDIKEKLKEVYEK